MKSGSNNTGLKRNHCEISLSSIGKAHRRIVMQQRLRKKVALISKKEKRRKKKESTKKKENTSADELNFFLLSIKAFSTAFSPWSYTEIIIFVKKQS
jgi:hypothetical protein